MAYIGRDIRTGAFRQLDDISSGFDGSDTTHTMQVNSTNVSVGDVNQILLSLGGVIQKPGTDFTVSGSTLPFTTAPAANTSCFAILLGSDNGGTVTPTDAAVTSGKLASTILTGATDIGGALADADLFLVDDGAGGTLRKVAASRIKTYAASTDLNGSEFILDADGDTSITADTDDQIDFKIAGSDKLSISSAGTLSLTSGNLEMDDTQELRLGTGNDFALNFDGTNSIIDHTPGSGGLYLRGDAILFQDSQSTPNTYFRIDQGAHAKAIIGTHNTYAFKVEHTADPNSAAPYGLDILYSGGAPDNDSNTANLFIQASDTGATRFKVAGDGDVMNHDNSYGSTSDERLKTNIVDANSQWDDIKALKIRNYEKKDDVELHGAGKKVQIGVIAQELETAGMTGLTKDGEPNAFDIKHGVPADGKVKSVKYSVLYMKAIKALQEAMAKIETLEADVKTLKSE